jgi:predicted ATPase
MHISRLRIKNFRSIDDLTLDLDRFAILCGANSCGKSNVFRAIQLAFREYVRKDDAQQNLPQQKLGVGAPTLSIWVTIEFEDVPKELREISGSNTGAVRYEFRLTRAGNITRKLGGVALTDDQFAILRERFLPIYVPPIRDLEGAGLEPFRQLMRQALQRSSRGASNVKSLNQTAKNLVKQKAQSILVQQSGLARRVLHVDALEIDASGVDVESIYDNVRLNVRVDGREMPLSALGTGHQSAVIMHLYRQLGAVMSGSVLFLFEEPDNHLHPQTTRAICDDLVEISRTSQVIVSTHSPIVISHARPSTLRPLVTNAERYTTLRLVRTTRSDRELRRAFEDFGLRMIEPLLATRVVVVEGPTDKAALAALYEARRGMTPDHADILIVAAGGKERVVRLCTLLGELGVEWRAVLDADALYAADTPCVRGGLSTQQKTNALGAMAIVRNVLDVSGARGKGIGKTLAAVEAELRTPHQRPAPLVSAPVQPLLSAALSTSEIGRLSDAVARQKPKLRRQLLEKSNLYCWAGDLEGALLQMPAAADIAEQALIRAGRIQGPLATDAERVDRLKATLKNSDANVIGDVVAAVDAAGLFGKSDVNFCWRFLFEGAE